MKGYFLTRDNSRFLNVSLQKCSVVATGNEQKVVYLKRYFNQCVFVYFLVKNSSSSGSSGF